MLPLVARGESIGLMEIVDTDDRDFDAHDVEFCQALCDVVATAVHNAQLYEQVKELALRDQVTQLYNRHCFEEQLAAAVARSRRSGESLALLVIDLDGLSGSTTWAATRPATRRCAPPPTRFARSCRLGDVPCRLGGDEFAVILPGATAEAAELVAERAQQRLRELGKGQFSFSGGVACPATIWPRPTSSTARPISPRTARRPPAARARWWRRQSPHASALQPRGFGTIFGYMAHPTDCRRCSSCRERSRPASI